MLSSPTEEKGRFLPFGRLSRVDEAQHGRRRSRRVELSHRRQEGGCRSRLIGYNQQPGRRGRRVFCPAGSDIPARSTAKEGRLTCHSRSELGGSLRGPGWHTQRRETRPRVLLWLLCDSVHRYSRRLDDLPNLLFLRVDVSHQSDGSGVIGLRRWGRGGCIVGQTGREPADALAVGAGGEDTGYVLGTPLRLWQQRFGHVHSNGVRLHVRIRISRPRRRLPKRSNKPNQHPRGTLWRLGQQRRERQPGAVALKTTEGSESFYTTLRCTYLITYYNVSRQLHKMVDRSLYAGGVVVVMLRVLTPPAIARHNASGKSPHSLGTPSSGENTLVTSATRRLSGCSGQNYACRLWFPAAT